MSGLGRVREIALVLVLALALGSTHAWASPAAQGGQYIAYGETVEGTITDTDSEQPWRFTGAAGDIVLIDMVASESSQLDPLLTLLDSSGNTLTSDDDGGIGLNARLGPYILPAGGEYTIQASHYSGTGHYTLHLQTLNTVPRLRQGKPLQGHLDNATPIEYYQIQAEGDAPELVRLDVVSDTGTLNYPLQVYAPSGYTVQGNPETPFTIDPLLLLPQTRYIVAVGQADEPTNGSYRIMLAPSEATLLRDGEPQRGHLSFTNTARYHYFVGQTGDTIRVTLETEDGFLPALFVQAQGSDEVLFSGDGNAMSHMSATLKLPLDGAYMIGIFGGQFATDQADYTLTVTWLER